MTSAFDLTGRTAIITGAGSGIGQASAIRLAEAGAAVVCADVSADTAELTASAIRADGGTASAHQVDVSRRADVEALVAGAGRLDIICNIAGIISPFRLVTDVADEELDHVLAINLKGVLYGCQAAAKVMVGQGHGTIINMSSGAIDAPQAGLICYALAKAGVAQLTKTLAVEVAAKGVRVNAIAPGLIVTNMTARHFVRPDGTIDEAARAAVLEPMRKRNPLGILGEADDVAYAVLYLASDAAKYVTGQILRPNGGVAMP